MKMMWYPGKLSTVKNQIDFVFDDDMVIAVSSAMTPRSDPEEGIEGTRIGKAGVTHG